METGNLPQSLVRRWLWKSSVERRVRCGDLRNSDEAIKGTVVSSSGLGCWADSFFRITAESDSPKPDR